MPMTTNTKIALGLAGVAVVTAAVVFYPKKASAGQGGGGSGGGPAPITKDSGIDLIAACVDGTKEGNLDGGHDGVGKSSQAPAPRMNYSTVTVVQAKYEECYQNAYSKAFAVAKAAKEVSKVTTYSMPPSGDLSAANAAGHDAGAAQAKLDVSNEASYQLDYSRVPAGYRTQPTNADLAKEWQDGYAGGYGEVWSKATPTSKYDSSGTDTGTGKPGMGESGLSDTPSDSTGSGIGDALASAWSSIVGGEAHTGAYMRVGGRMVPTDRVRNAQTGGRTGAILLPKPAINQPRAGYPMHAPGSSQTGYPMSQPRLMSAAGAMGVVTAPFSLAAKVSSGLYDRSKAVFNHIRTKGVVGGALTARAYFG